MKIKNILWIFASVILLLSTIMNINIIDKNSTTYLLLGYIGAGLAIIITIMIIGSLIKNKGEIK
ncbi:MAG: hypothetical protein KGH55_01140 [Nanoarchaeota archaeon]|nr:hypothetical protein [Nanoarchaeota archaeon]